MSTTPDLEAWRKARTAAVTAPTGNLAMISYQPVTRREEVEEVPGLTVEPADGGGVHLTPDEGVEAAVDGVPMQGRTHVDRLGPDGTPLVSCGRFTLDVFSLDGTDHELRIYDPESDARARFSHIENYDEDPAAVHTGVLRPFPADEQVPWDFTRESDSGHTKKVPGLIDVTIGGRDYSLVAFSDGPRTVVVFGDATSGVESYGAGRFLLVDAPDEQGRVTLDFNRAFIPPCGFSMFYSCPVPPAQNRIDAPIRAGEKRVVFTGDED